MRSPALPITERPLHKALHVKCNFNLKVSFQHKEYYIEVFDDSEFTQTSDSPTQYDKLYEPEVDREFKSSSQHAVLVYNGEKQVSSAIIVAAAGATSVSEDSTLIYNNNSLIVRCSNIIVNLTIPMLDLIWMTSADPITCFSVHQYQDTLITHGELTVCRIDISGNIMWEFGADDILLRIDGDNCFSMNNDSISLQNFNGDKYEIDYDGNLLAKPNIQPIGESVKRRKWWQFWR